MTSNKYGEMVHHSSKVSWNPGGMMVVRGPRMAWWTAWWPENVSGPWQSHENGSDPYS